MGNIVSDAHGITNIDYLERAIKSDYYVALLDRLNDEIKKKTAAYDEEENAVQMLIKVMVKLDELR